MHEKTLFLTCSFPKLLSFITDRVITFPSFTKKRSEITIIITCYSTKYFFFQIYGVLKLDQTPSVVLPFSHSVQREMLWKFSLLSQNTTQTMAWTQTSRVWWTNHHLPFSVSRKHKNNGLIFECFNWHLHCFMLPLTWITDALKFIGGKLSQLRLFKLPLYVMNCCYHWLLWVAPIQSIRDSCVRIMWYHCAWLPSGSKNKWDNQQSNFILINRKFYVQCEFRYRWSCDIIKHISWNGHLSYC